MYSIPPQKYCKKKLLERLKQRKWIKDKERVCLQENTDKNPGDMRTAQAESIETGKKMKEAKGGGNGTKA